MFDIIHPANVHYFKNTIKLLKNNAYDVIITARDKEVSYKLLDAEEFKYVKMGKNPKNTVGKILFLLWCEFKTFLLFLKYRPSLTLSFGASYYAHNSFILGIPHIALDDTEHAKLNRKLYLPFSSLVLTPESFWLNLGIKQIRFPGHMELFYLSNKYFKPDKSIYNLLKIKEAEKYIFLRFISWNAYHDKGQSGLSLEYKIKLINELSNRAKIFISAEGDLPGELEKFRINVPPHLIHHVLYFAELFIGEGATMASECAAIGTPAIYVNSLNAGTLDRQEKDGLIFNYRNQDGVIEKAEEILNNPEAKKELKLKLAALGKNRIELTDFLFWLITRYPESKSELLSNKNWTKNFLIESL
jgi:uncharacterized protein